MKATQEELDDWLAASRLAGRPLNSWMRKALNERAELDRALERQRRRDDGLPEVE